MIIMEISEYHQNLHAKAMEAWGKKYKLAALVFFGTRYDVREYLIEKYGKEAW